MQQTEAVTRANLWTREYIVGVSRELPKSRAAEFSAQFGGVSELL